MQPGKKASWVLGWILWTVGAAVPAAVQAGDICELPCDFAFPPYAAPLQVDLEIRPALIKGIAPGEIVNLSLYAAPTQPVPTLISGVEGALVWDSDQLELCGIWNNGPYEWVESRFPDDSGGADINAGLSMGTCGTEPENPVPFNDGDAFFSALGQFPPPFGPGEALLPGTGLLVTTFQFRVITDQPLDANVSMVDSLGSTCTIVGWGRGGECSGNSLPCNALDANSCAVGTCVPLDPQPGCSIYNQSEGARVVGPCSVPCGDVDENSITDDSCMFYNCELSDCMELPRTYADMGGANGSCPPDGTCDANDRFHALNCFANVDTFGAGSTYPCEPSPPSALNVDVAALGEACTPDGVCDGNDAFAAINCFTGAATCSCAGPAPQIDFRQRGAVALAGLVAEARTTVVAAGERVLVDVYLDGKLEDLRGYQLHMLAQGGFSGRLELADIIISEDGPLAGLGAWSAFNLLTAQMVTGLDSDGVPADAGSHLATFVYHTTPKTAGVFSIEVLADRGDPGQHSILFPTPVGSRIDIDDTAAAFVEVVGRGNKTARVRSRSVR